MGHSPYIVILRFCFAHPTCSGLGWAIIASLGDFKVAQGEGQTDDSVKALGREEVLGAVAGRKEREAWGSTGLNMVGSPWAGHSAAAWHILGGC